MKNWLGSVSAYLHWQKCDKCVKVTKNLWDLIPDTSVIEQVLAVCLCTNVYVQIQYVSATLCFCLLDVGHIRYCKQYVEQLLDCEPHVNSESQYENQSSSSSETITSLIVTITRINLVLHQRKSVESRKTIYALRFKVLLSSRCKHCL